MERQQKGTCSICGRAVFDNANPEKIITCARCTQILLTVSVEEKMRYSQKLLSEGKNEAARSVQSFIEKPVEAVEAVRYRPYKNLNSQLFERRVKTCMIRNC